MGGREGTTTSTYDSRYASADVSLLNYISIEVNKPFGSQKREGDILASLFRIWDSSNNNDVACRKSFFLSAFQSKKKSAIC